MLILSRKSCESVVIGDPAGSIKQTLRVTVLAIHRDKVKLGFEAAADVPVNRWEVWKDIHAGVGTETWRSAPSPFDAR
jgi:carbon storage regulator CsrA